MSEAEFSSSSSVKKLISESTTTTGAFPVATTIRFTQSTMTGWLGWGGSSGCSQSQTRKCSSSVRIPNRSSRSQMRSLGFLSVPGAPVTVVETPFFLWKAATLLDEDSGLIWLCFWG